MWRVRADPCGSRFWMWVCKQNFTVDTTGSVTFACDLSKSAIDLSIFLTNLSVASWGTVDFATSSDHFPILFVVKSSSFKKDFFVPILFITGHLTMPCFVHLLQL